MPAAADAELCNDTSELLKRRNKRVTVQGWVCQQVWEPKNVHAGKIVGASGEIQSNRQHVPLVCHTTPQSKLYAALTDPQRGLQAGVVYTLRNVIPKNPPKDRQDGRRVVDLHVDNFSELDRTGTDKGRVEAPRQQQGGEAAAAAAAKAAAAAAAAAAAPELQQQTPDQVLSSHAEGDTDICLRLDATCALPNDKGGWLLEDAAGTELRLARGQISAQTGQRMQKAFMSGALVISVQATPVKLVSREERIFSGVSKAVQGKKVQTKVAVLSGAGGAPLDAGAGQRSGQGQAKRKSGKAAVAAGDSAAAGGGKAAKRVKK